MPDICGYWDRRADDKDFNPDTGEIEKGYARRLQQRRRREQTREQRERKKRIKEAGLEDFDFKDGRYQLDGQGDIERRVGDIERRVEAEGEEEGCEETYHVGVTQKGYVVVKYDLPQPHHLRSPSYDHRRTLQNSYALEFADLLLSKGISIREEPPRNKVSASLQERVDRLIHLRSETERVRAKF